MGADVSRVRFDPLRDFAGVVLQQGRLLLDGDFNEYVALLDRRLRAETCDLTSFGPDPDHAGVAWVPRQTPDALPRHGRRRRAHDRPRADVRRRPARREPRPAAARRSTRCSPSRPARADTPYDEQPYWPTPDPLPDRRPAPRLPRRLAARGHAPRGSRASSRSRSASTRPRARRRSGRCGCCRDVGGATCASDDDDIPGWLDADRALGRPPDHRHDRRRRRRRPVRAAADAAATAGSRTRPTASRSTTAARPARRPSSGRATTARSRMPGRRDGLDDGAPARLGRQGRRPARLDRRLGRDPRRPLRAGAASRA